jgi:hypothetical protein
MPPEWWATGGSLRTTVQVRSECDAVHIGCPQGSCRDDEGVGDDIAVPDCDKDQSRCRAACFGASVSIASPVSGSDWSWLHAPAPAFDRHELAQIEETGMRASVEPAHLPAIEAMIPAREACRSESWAEGARTFDIDPRAHVHASAR